MWTPEGRRKRDQIARAATFDGLLDTVREVMSGLTNTISERVKDTGAGASEKGGAAKRFSPYSDSYKPKRRAAGKGTSKKDFSLTDSMWESFKIVDEEVNSAMLTFTYNVTGQNSDSRRTNAFLVDAHSDREGTNILFPNGKELQELEKKVQEKVNEYLSNVFR